MVHEYANTKEKLSQSLEALLRASKRLRKGLLLANPQIIQSAIDEQTEHLRLLAAVSAELQGVQNAPEILDLVNRIKAINATNETLSRAGLSAIRGAVNEMQPSLGYDPDGHTPVLTESSRVCTSV